MYWGCFWFFRSVHTTSNEIEYIKKHDNQGQERFFHVVINLITWLLANSLLNAFSFIESMYQNSKSIIAERCPSEDYRELTGIAILLSWKATPEARKTSPIHAPFAWKCSITYCCVTSQMMVFFLIIQKKNHKEEKKEICISCCTPCIK